MCFSLEASAVVAGVLIPLGAVSTVHAWKTPKRYFAMIPLLFGIQQGIEALQWLADKPSLCSTSLGYGFLFFAFLVWPLFTPFSYWYMEEQSKRKQWFSRFMWIGGVVSFVLFISLLTSPLLVSVDARHIVYDVSVPLAWVTIAAYVFSVCSGFFSSHLRAKILAGTTLVGFLVAALFYFYAFTSVWCFFAAVLSVFVLWEVFHEEKKKLSSQRIKK